MSKDKIAFKLGSAANMRRFFEENETLALSTELVDQLAKDYERAAWNAACSARNYASFVDEEHRLNAIWDEAVATTVERLIAILMHGTDWLGVDDRGLVSMLPKRPNFGASK